MAKKNDFLWEEFLYKFSPGKLYEWQCPRRIWIAKHGVQKESPVNGVSLTLGSIVHGVIDRVLKKHDKVVCSEMLQDFDQSWGISSRIYSHRETDQLRELGRRCISNFCHRYGAGNEAKDVLDSEVAANVKICRDGSIVRSIDENYAPYYELVGRIDSIERGEQDTIRIRDFKINFKKNRLALYRLQFGIYALCLEMFLRGRKVDCQIFDLSGGEIQTIDPLPADKIHKIVTTTIERVEKNPKARNTRFCLDCRFEHCCKIEFKSNQLDLDL